MINFFNINKKSKIILINFLISVSFLVISFYFTYNAIYGNNGLKKSIVLELEIIELNNKLNIPIAEIKTLRQNGWKTNDLATFIFTIAGGASGSIAGIFIDIGLFETPWGATNDWQALIYLVSIGGGARIGYKLGKSIFKRRYKALEFEGLTSVLIMALKPLPSLLVAIF